MKTYEIVVDGDRMDMEYEAETPGKAITEFVKDPRAQHVFEPEKPDSGPWSGGPRELKTQIVTVSAIEVVDEDEVDEGDFVFPESDDRTISVDPLEPDCEIEDEHAWKEVCFSAKGNSAFTQWECDNCGLVCVEDGYPDEPWLREDGCVTYIYE